MIDILNAARYLIYLSRLSEKTPPQSMIETGMNRARKQSFGYAACASSIRLFSREYAPNSHSPDIFHTETTFT